MSIDITLGRVFFCYWGLTTGLVFEIIRLIMSGLWITKRGLTTTLVGFIIKGEDKIKQKNMKTKKEKKMRVEPLKPITVKMLKKNPKLGKEKYNSFIKR